MDAGVGLVDADASASIPPVEGEGNGSGAASQHSDGPPPKKARRNARESAEHKIKQAQEKIQAEQARIAALPPEQERDWNAKRVHATHEKKIAACQETIRVETAKLGEMRQKAAQLKATQEATKLDSQTGLSDAAVLKLVNIRLEQERHFANAATGTSAAWALVHQVYIAAVDAGELPESDRRSSRALVAR